MEWSDFCHHVAEIGSCAPFMQTDGEHHDIRCNSMSGAWLAGETAGGKHGLSTFRFNPCYRFVATDPSVTITLYQLDQRGHAVKVPWLDIYLYLLPPESHSALEAGAKAELQKKGVKPLLSLSTRLKSLDTAVTPGTQYTLVPCAHSAGVEGHFCITIASRSGVILEQLTTGCGVRPTASDRIAMAPFPNRSAVCYICKEEFGVGVPYFEFPEGRVHAETSPKGMECKQTYYEQTSEKCLSCGKGVLPGSRHYTVEDGKQVHEGDCYEKYQVSTAPKCCMCSAPLLGSYYPVGDDDGSETPQKKKVCAEGPGDCLNKWKESVADKCHVCGKAVLGGYYQPEEEGIGLKVHSEGDCWQRYQRSR
jgi:hypothetical protein